MGLHAVGCVAELLKLEPQVYQELQVQKLQCCECHLNGTAQAQQQLLTAQLVTAQKGLSAALTEDVYYPL